MQKHPEMQGLIDEIITVLQKPLKITEYSIDEHLRYYYCYFKNRNSPAKYLRVIVKYLNGEGFVITSYFVETIQ